MPALALEYPPNLVWGQALACPPQGHSGTVCGIEYRRLPDGAGEWWVRLDTGTWKVWVPHALCQAPRDLSPFWARLYGGRRRHWWQPTAGERSATARCGRQAAADVDQVRERYAGELDVARCPDCERLVEWDRKRGAL